MDIGCHGALYADTDGLRTGKRGAEPLALQLRGRHAALRTRTAFCPTAHAHEQACSRMSDRYIGFDDLLVEHELLLLVLGAPVCLFIRLLVGEGLALLVYASVSVDGRDFRSPLHLSSHRPQDIHPHLASRRSIYGTAHLHRDEHRLGVAIQGNASRNK